MAVLPFFLSQQPCGSHNQPHANTSAPSLSKEVSSPEELPPQALSEPDVNLSIHTAPSVQPPEHPSDLACAQGSSSEELARIGLKLNHRRTFGPAPLQGLHPYYERLCPCAPHRYSGSCRGLRLELLPSHQDDRFSRSSPKPDPRSRRLYAGRRSSTKQVRLDLHPGVPHRPQFRRRLGFLDTSSTVHFRSSPWIAPDAVIAAPFPATLTTKALYPSSLQWFEVCSCKPTPEGPPPSSAKHRRSCVLPPFCNTGSFVRDTRAA